MESMNLGRIIIALVIGYLFGNIPSGYIVAKAHGVDIYHEGSGNPGSTNVLRTMGKKAGAIVLFMDLLKTMIPFFILYFVFGIQSESDRAVLCLCSGFGTVLGHNFPCVKGMKGGKGVACSGAAIILYNPLIALGLLILLILIVRFTAYVSLGSMIGLSSFFLCTLIFGRMQGIAGNAYLITCSIAGIMALLSIYQHRANIKRLMNGTENRFGQKKA